MSEELNAEVLAKEVETELLAKEAEKERDIDPVEIAAQMLTYYTPRFNMLVDKLSSRQLKRVTKSLVEFPLGKNYKHNDPVEKETFIIGQRLLDAKQVMIVHTYTENRERILNLAAEAAGKEEGKENG